MSTQELSNDEETNASCKIMVLQITSLVVVSLYSNSLNMNVVCMYAYNQEIDKQAVATSASSLVLYVFTICCMIRFTV